jgi:hypothetical protein
MYFKAKNTLNTHHYYNLKQSFNRAVVFSLCYAYGALFIHVIFDFFFFTCLAIFFFQYLSRKDKDKIKLRIYNLLVENR